MAEINRVDYFLKIIELEKKDRFKDAENLVNEIKKENIYSKAIEIEESLSSFFVDTSKSVGIRKSSHKRISQDLRV